LAKTRGRTLYLNGEACGFQGRDGETLNEREQCLQLSDGGGGVGRGGRAAAGHNGREDVDVGGVNIKAISKVAHLGVYLSGMDLIIFKSTCDRSRTEVGNLMETDIDWVTGTDCRNPIERISLWEYVKHFVLKILNIYCFSGKKGVTHMLGGPYRLVSRAEVTVLPNKSRDYLSPFASPWCSSRVLGLCVLRAAPLNSFVFSRYWPMGRGRKSKLSSAQLDFLESHVAEFLALQPHLTRFWTKVEKGWFRVFPVETDLGLPLLDTEGVLIEDSDMPADHQLLVGQAQEKNERGQFYRLAVGV
jgi:hypothetical protein